MPAHRLVSVRAVAVAAGRHQVALILRLCHADAHLVLDVAQCHWVVIHVERIFDQRDSTVPTIFDTVRIVTAQQNVCPFGY